MRKPCRGDKADCTCISAGPRNVKHGSEVVIKVHTSALYGCAAEEREKVHGNEKAIYVLFSIPVDCFLEVTDLRTGKIFSRLKKEDLPSTGL